MSELLEAFLQVHALLCPLRLLQTLLWGILRMGLGISVHNAHFMNTVCLILPEVAYQEVSLLFRGLWWRRIVPVSCACGIGRISLRPLHSATCKYESFVAHVIGDE